MSIKEKIIQYFKTTKKLKIAGDILFYIFLILLIIPASRREIITTVKRYTLIRPRVIERSVLGILNENDYQFTLEDINGTPFILQDFSNEVLFINFWASWCPPCRAEMPEIEKLYSEFKDKVKFLLITGEQNEPVKNYLEKYKYNFPVYFQRSKLPVSFNVSTIPHTFVIDRNGNILFSKTGAAKWNSTEFKKFLDSII